MLSFDSFSCFSLASLKHSSVLFKTGKKGIHFLFLIYTDHIVTGKELFPKAIKATSDAGHVHRDPASVSGLHTIISL